MGLRSRREKSQTCSVPMDSLGHQKLLQPVLAASCLRGLGWTQRSGWAPVVMTGNNWALTGVCGSPMLGSFGASSEDSSTLHCTALFCLLLQEEVWRWWFLSLPDKKKNKIKLDALLFNLCNAQTNEIQEKEKFIIYFKINVLLGGRTRCFTHS